MRSCAARKLLHSPSLLSVIFLIIMSISSSTVAARRQWKYDVFLNFRGGDIRRTFLSHLREALCRADLVTFFDENLMRGEEISPALLKAIEDSNVAVPIFSKDYASSPWCLEELVKIIDCYKYRGQIVIPVFYDVSSSVVLDQSGIYAEAFAKHEKDWENARYVPQWKAAMTKAANLSGRSARNARSDSELVKEIVNDILIRLGRTPNGTDRTVEIGSGMPRSLYVKVAHTRTMEIQVPGGPRMRKVEDLPVDNLDSLLEPLQHLSEASLQALKNSIADSSNRRASAAGIEDYEESKNAGQKSSTVSNSKNEIVQAPASARSPSSWRRQPYNAEAKNFTPVVSTAVPSSSGKSSFFRSSADEKIVLYFTSMEANRKTFRDCSEVRQIFRSLQVAVDERNTFDNRLHIEQLQSALGTKTFSLPAVFIGGKHLGGLEDIRQLYEAGKLKQLVQGFPVQNRAASCEACGDTTYVLCPKCGPGRTCWDCKRNNGMVRCSDCC